MVFFGSGAPARDAEGRRPSDPGMTELSSDRLRNINETARGDHRHARDLHVPKHVLRDQNTVKLPRAGDHDHSRRVYQLMLQFQLGVFLSHELSHRLPPESRRSQDIGLVDRDDGKRRISRQGDLSCYASDALHLGDGVDTCVPCDSGSIRFLSLAKV